MEKPINFAVGKRYVTHDGEVLKCVSIIGRDKNYPIQMEDKGGQVVSYTSDGYWLMGVGRGWNIKEEYHES